MRPNDDGRWNHRVLKGILIALVILIFILVFTNLGAFSTAVSGLLQVVSSILYGFLFAYLLNPFVSFVDKRLAPVLAKRWKKTKRAYTVSRVVGILFAFSVAALLIYAMINMIVPQLATSIVKIGSKMESYFRSVETWVLNILEGDPKIKEYVDMGLEKLFAFLDNFVENELLGSAQKIVTQVTVSVYAVIREIVNMVIGIVVAIYVLFSKDKFLAQSKKMTIAFFEPETADRLMEHGRQINKIFNGFIIGKLIDSLIIGILCYIGVALLRMPYAVLIATIVGITNVIPYFGPILGAVPCAVLVLLEDPLKCFYFVIFILVLQQIDGNIIGPRILGENLGISSFWILVSISVGGGLFGFVGLLLGVPVFCVIYMLVSDAVNRKLRRKGMQTVTDAYLPIRTVDDLMFRQTPPEPSEETPPKKAPEAAPEENEKIKP